MSTTTSEPDAAGVGTVERVTHARRSRARRRGLVIVVLAVAVVVAYAITLMAGRTFYPPGDVIRVVMGEEVTGASFTVGTLRLPRATLGLLVGLCFGLGGVTFQTMLRNPLASPDIIGISAGSSAAAVFAIVYLSLDGIGVSVFAIVAGLGIAVLIYLLSFKGGVSGTRLILIGMGSRPCSTASCRTSSNRPPSGTCRRRCGG